MLYNFIHLLHR